ncbi:MAG: Creatininase [Acidimicrobiia bacterium]|nr:Creatininase [Acidimicrobiia bacterium]
MTAPHNAPASVSLHGATWPDVADRAATTVLVVPLGSTEQHGPHLSLATDSVIATALAQAVALRCPQVLVAPTVPYGSSGEHAGFAGTLSIGQAALELLVLELVRSADAFAAVLLLSAHGGNAEPLARAVATLHYEGRTVAAWSPTPAALAHESVDAHAGRFETSIMLAVAPELVTAERAAAGNTSPLRELATGLRSGGVRAVSANGVLGDPTGASAAEGHRLLELLIDDLIGSVQALQDRMAVHG